MNMPEKFDYDKTTKAFFIIPQFVSPLLSLHHPCLSLTLISSYLFVAIMTLNRFMPYFPSKYQQQQEN